MIILAYIFFLLLYFLHYIYGNIERMKSILIVNKIEIEMNTSLFEIMLNYN